MPRSTTVVVIGAGQAGLAMSRCLSDRSIDHVVVERGRVAERWRSERWRSLRLLTPNWMTRLPAWGYVGDEPDGYMTMPEVIGFLEDYADSFAAPVLEHTEVVSVDHDGRRFVVDTVAEGECERWHSDRVVIATGPFHEARRPACAPRVAGDIAQTTPDRYRQPGDLPDGGVLVVGASATGVQLTDELVRDGRSVTLAVGRHTRLPRRYRGLDIHWWLDQLGVLDVGIDDVADVAAARREPSLQLAGDTTGRALGLDRLRDSGVRLVGRLADVDGHRVTLERDLARTCGDADRRQGRMLSRIDAHIDTVGLGAEVGPVERPAPVRPGRTPAHLDLRAEGISTVVWATGYRRTYPWLRVPVLGADGEIRHRGGVTEFPGLYVVGLPFLRRRKSTFIDGVGRDAEELADHLAARLGPPTTMSAHGHVGGSS